MPLPYDPTIALLGICHRESKTYVHIKTCFYLHIKTQMFLAALFIITQNCYQANPYRYDCAIAQYSVIRRDKLLMPEITWMNLQGIMLSGKGNPERSHTVWCYLHNVFEITKFGKQKID